MKESTKDKGKRILSALLEGRKLTPAEANAIGNTTDGTRYIRYYRQQYPIKSEKVEGELYRRYWIDEEYLAQLKQTHNEVQAGTFFNAMLDGGMFQAI